MGTGNFTKLDVIKGKIDTEDVFEPNPIFLSFIQLPTDYTLDCEIAGMLNQVDAIKWRLQKLHYIQSDVNITVDYFKRLQQNIKYSISVFNQLDSSNVNYGTTKVITLACTSMSFLLTPEVIHKELLISDNIITNDMATSVLNAVNSLKKHKDDKIALLTPYIDEVHKCNIDFLFTNGCNVVLDYNLNFKNDSLTSGLNPIVIDLLIGDMLDKFEGKIEIFILGCNAFRVTEYGFIDKLEKKYNIKVVTSNQATIWNSLQLALANTSKISMIKNMKGYGMLFNVDKVNI